MADSNLLTGGPFTTLPAAITASGTGNAQDATGSGNVTAAITATGVGNAQDATGTGNVDQGIATASGIGNAQSATGSGNVTAAITATGTGNAQSATGSGNVDEIGAPTVTITLTDELGTPLANLTGLKGAWFDQATPDLFQAPVEQSSTLTTDGSGVLTWEIPSTTLNPGQIGWLDVTDSDGTTTQNPPHKAFSGPLAVT